MDVPMRRIRYAVISHLPPGSALPTVGQACLTGHVSMAEKNPRQEPLMPPTHEVFNQPPALTGYDVADDPAMLAALRREGAGWAEDGVRELGRLAGSALTQELGRQANENPPRLRTHDRFGNRVDEVEFHPAWHELLHLAVASGIHALPWREPVPGAQAGRAAMMLAMSGVESGTGCPLSMTYAGVPALRAQPG